MAFERAPILLAYKPVYESIQPIRRMTVRRQIRRLRESLERAARRAARDTRNAGRINVARRTNVIVSTNIGGEGAVHGASSRQNAPIRQRGGEQTSGER